MNENILFYRIEEMEIMKAVAARKREKEDDRLARCDCMALYYIK